MNAELKNLVVLVFDGLTVAKDVAQKKNFFMMLPDLYKVSMDAVPAVASWNDLQAELAALAGSEQEADLVAFVQSKFGENCDSVKAQAILAAALKLVQDMAQDALALQAAIKA